MKWLEDWDNVGGEGVTFHNGAVDQDEKKIGMNRGMKESGSERTKKKEKKNAIRTLRATRKEKKEKENERNKEKKEKKRWKRKKSTKVGIHIPPSPTALEYKN